MYALPSWEFTTLQAFFELEPWGCEIDNQRMATIAWSVFRAAGAKDIKLTHFYRNPYKDPVDELTLEQREFLARKKRKRAKQGKADG